MGGKDYDGYGIFSLNRKAPKAHRVSYEYWNGIIPKGLQIDHLCRNTSCVNPQHLEAVTCEENLLRGNGFGAINSKKTHCPKEHPYSGENLYLRRNGKTRVCLICKRESDKKVYYKKRRKLNHDSL